MNIKRQKDGSVSAAHRCNGRLIIAEGNNAREAISACFVMTQEHLKKSNSKGK